MTNQDSLSEFKKNLSEGHYSGAFVLHLAEIVATNSKLATIQEVYELIQRECEMIVNYFKLEEAQHCLIQYRTPLCFESLSQYFHTMTRQVYKQHGSDIARLKQALVTTAHNLVEVLSASTSRIVDNSKHILSGNVAKKILVYSYSKSIELSLCRLRETLEDNLQVLVCRSGSLQQGIKLYEELVVEGINCHLINQNQIGYYIGQIDIVLLGAEVILQNGAIINRAGTSMVALLAHAAHKPVYVFAESYKFLRRNYFSQRDIPQRFREDKQRKIKTISIDLTLPEHITLFCTDSGIYPPHELALELSKILRGIN